MSEFLNQLGDEDLDSIAGGMVVNAAGHEGDPNLPWEVVANNDCHVIRAFSTQAEACAFADTFNKKGHHKDPYNTQLVDWATVERLRANPNVN